MRSISARSACSALLLVVIAGIGASACGDNPAPAPTSYTVRYDANGATSGTVPEAGTYAAGATVTVAENSGGLAKAGFDFAGWNPSADGSGPARAPGATFVLGEADVTLFANWTPASAATTFRVTYDGNGATSGTVPVDARAYREGDLVGIQSNTGALVRDGLTFGGWNTRADGSGEARAAGSSFAMGRADVVLYARWLSGPTYRVLYDGNGATSGAAPVDANAYPSGATVTVAGAGGLVRVGFTFAGWNPQADGSGTALAPGATFTLGAADATLFAQWTSLPVFHVSYDGNGSTAGAAPVDNMAYHQGDLVTVAGANDLRRQGWSFGGWNTRPDGSGAAQPAASMFAMPAMDVVLYATWTALPTYHVIYDGNGATGGMPPQDGAAYLDGDRATVLAPATLVRAGYVFDGWTRSAAGGGTVYQPGDLVLLGPADVTLYAQWIPATYRVTYDGNGATSGAVPVDAAAYHDGDTATVLGNAGALARAGYTFAGWNTRADGGGTQYGAGAMLPVGMADVVLYARWTPIVQTINFNANQGAGSMANVTAETDAMVTLPVVKFTRYAYAFAGWATSPTGPVVYADKATLTMGPASLTLHAKWTLRMVDVPAGSFQRDGTANNVSAVSAFSISKYEITQNQLLDAGMTNNSSFNADLDNPATNASFYMAVVFCNKMSLLEGLTPVYSISGKTDPKDWGSIPIADSATWNAVKADWSASGYRLPTEMEWNWAAMGATQGSGYVAPVYRTGYTKDFPGDNGFTQQTDYCWVSTNSGNAVHKVGTKTANELGLHDMGGNVFEWVWDPSAAWPGGLLTDYRGPASSGLRSLLGGAYYNTWYTAIDYRNDFGGYNRTTGLGFRVARNR